MLYLDDFAERLKDAVHQMQSSVLHMEAGSLLLKDDYSPHPLF